MANADSFHLTRAAACCLAAAMLAAAGCAKVADSDAGAANTTDAAPVSKGETDLDNGATPAAADVARDKEAGEAAASTATGASDDREGAVIRGTVKFAGQPPERLEIDMTQVPECVKVHGSDTILNEDVVVGPGGEVKSAFVYIKRAAKPPGEPSSWKPAALNQEKCMYRPRVQGVRVGQTLQIRNSDEFAHNVRGYPNLNPIFNIGQPGQGDVREKVFDLAENPPIKFKCDLHKWMTAYVFVMDHPYFAVTGDDGTFEIAGLPPGDYTLALWHEKFGKNEQKITVGEKDLAGVDFTLHQEP